MFFFTGLCVDALHSDLYFLHWPSLKLLRSWYCVGAQQRIWTWAYLRFRLYWPLQIKQTILVVPSVFWVTGGPIVVFVKLSSHVAAHVKHTRYCCLTESSEWISCYYYYCCCCFIIIVVINIVIIKPACEFFDSMEEPRSYLPVHHLPPPPSDSVLSHA